MRKLERVRFYTWYKEEVRDCSTRMYSLIRRISLEVGRRLADQGVLNGPDDLFFLPYTEVIAVLHDEMPERVAIRRRIEANRNYMCSFRHFKNPNEVGDRWQYNLEKTGVRSVTDRVCQGIACAPGKVSGQVRILLTIQEGSRLRKGDILVTPFTDPGWTPLFSLVSGVITETGGILSHAAVIAREYGVPAVLALEDATSRFKDGQRIILDGNRGEVRVQC